MRISILGRLVLQDPSGGLVQLPTRKSALLLAALVLAGDKGVRREALAAAFWPDRSETQARGSLRHALAALRRAFPEHAGVVVAGDLEVVTLSAVPDDVDVWMFERLAASAEARELAGAAALYSQTSRCPSRSINGLLRISMRCGAKRYNSSRDSVWFPPPTWLRSCPRPRGSHIGCSPPTQPPKKHIARSFA